MPEFLIARQAEHDGHCPLCKQVILGWDGKRNTRAVDEAMAYARGEDIPPAHPRDTLDQIVKLDGAWVHADCARDAGAVVSS